MLNDNENFVLVIGSKQNSKLPDTKVKKIYCANGAAERGILYKKYFQNIETISVVSASEINKREEVREKIINFKPQKIFCRFGKLDRKMICRETLDNIEIVELGKFNQLIWQSKFYKFGIINLFTSEYFYYHEIKKKIKYFSDCLRWRGFLGSSTGLFSILLAHIENPNKKILVSGIGIKSGGETFYGTNKDRTNRHRVDQKLFFNLKNKIKNQIITTDKEMSDYCKIPLWKGSYLP